VVMLAAVTGVAPQPVIAARALNTALGGALALIAYAVWPSWERKQTRDALACMLDAYRAYTHAVLGAWEGGAASEIDRVRDEARRARSNAEASVDRMSGEPGVTAKQTASLGAILVNSHSFVHAVMAMESGLYGNRRDPAPAWMHAFAESTDRALVKLAAVLKNANATRTRRSKVEVETPPPGTGGNELLEMEADRVRTSLRSLGEELARRDWL